MSFFTRSSGFPINGGNFINLLPDKDSGLFTIFSFQDLIVDDIDYSRKKILGKGKERDGLQKRNRCGSWDELMVCQCQRLLP